MYCPNAFAVQEAQACHALMAAHPLAHLVRLEDGQLCADALVLWPDAERGVLQGHIARANPLAQAEACAVLAIFSGADAYVSPSWLPGKAEHGRVVPTWNYSVVHAHGMLRVIDDEVWVRAQITRLTAAHEAGFAAPWQLDDAPADYLAAMLRAVVGIEISISRLQGKAKLSQNRSAAEQAGIRHGLAACADEASRTVAAAMDRFATKEGEQK
ncbi:FMN-binding negative transcriptional regulator [Craterilacuibacter sp. RT1T]|uniref:FMN-binding negative transcriptional regulator n=1 Tax=Craterilacuibacter sp. RT1T TaxID=2942211 RepID=UPI0020BF09DB|nr:FMN-binding negative transcriptional regulator [Craterilacuibacter sp. RT1T]MCL6261781.1 FMN-binding negative transcriptional regulator [Craterilacuibacter sp. RT1T]